MKITVPVKEKFSYVVYEYPDFTIHLTVYLVRIKEGIIEMREHADIKWITFEEIESYDFSSTDNEILAEIKSEF